MVSELTTFQACCLACSLPSWTRITGWDATLIHEFIEVGEFGLALEQIADVVSEDEIPLSDDECRSMIALNAEMGMGGRVPDALRLCPRTR